MKTKKKTNQTYLSAFVDLYEQIQINPMLSVTDHAEKFSIGKHPYAMLVKVGIVDRTKLGLKWVGPEPTIDMVIQIRTAISLYHKELEQKKRQQGDLFKRSKATKRIKESHSEWTERVKQQKAEKSEVLIQQPMPDSSLVSEYIDHNEPVTVTIEVRESWFKRLIRLIFNIK